jgi:zeaxanthin glucosyltransferase
LGKRADFSRSFGIGVKGIKRLVISPAAFDFPHPEANDVFRIGPLVDIKREGRITKPRYVNLLKRLNSGESSKSEFVVYCSMGTVTASFKKDVSKFFKKMAAVARLNSECLFIVSTGADFDTAELFPTPNNLFVFDNVPQVELLQYCKLMITHGGMNSITECIYNHVPMLVYPLSPRWDQPGNSARVEYHNLGLRGKIKKDSVQKISGKINKLKTGYKFYQLNIRLMKEKFEENNNSDRLLDLIESELN